MAIKSHPNNKNWNDNYDKVFGKKPKIRNIEEVDKLARKNKKVKPVIIQEQASTIFNEFTGGDSKLYPVMVEVPKPNDSLTEESAQAPMRKRTRSRSHQVMDDKKKY